MEVTTEQAVFLLPIAAGSFLYIAIADLIQELFKQKKQPSTEHVSHESIHLFSRAISSTSNG